MGARNSTPQTARIDNPQRGISIQLTPSVVSRLEGGQEQRQQTDCAKHKENQPQQMNQEQFSSEIIPQALHNEYIQGNDVFQRKSNESEELQFVNTIEQIETIIGKPLTYIEGVGEELQVLKAALLKCYRAHPGQSLSCADVAKNYQDFIFREQYKSILKFNAQYDEPPQ